MFIFQTSQSRLQSLTHWFKWKRTVQESPRCAQHTQQHTQRHTRESVSRRGRHTHTHTHYNYFWLTPETIWAAEDWILIEKWMENIRMFNIVAVGTKALPYNYESQSFLIMDRNIACFCFVLFYFRTQSSWSNMKNCFFWHNLNYKGRFYYIDLKLI